MVSVTPGGAGGGADRPRPELGARYDPKVGSWPEGAQFWLRGGRHEITLFGTGLSARAVRAIQKGRVELALIDAPPVVILLIRIGRAIEWWPAPFAWHLTGEPDARRAGTVEGQTHLEVVTVQSEDGVVVGLRSVSATAPFSAALQQAIASQAARPWDGSRYALKLVKLHSRCRTPEAWLARATARCRCRSVGKAAWT